MRNISAVVCDGGSPVEIDDLLGRFLIPPPSVVFVLL